VKQYLILTFLLFFHSSTSLLLFRGVLFKMPAMVDAKLDKPEDSNKASNAGGGDKQLQGNGPLTLNRPPSTTPSTTSATGAQRTTTSRRGGRTRSRSPPVMGNRLSGPGDIMSPSIGGDNPSSAAAMAAAAAKAFSTGGRNPNTWSEGPPDDPAFHPGYDKLYSNVANWPGGEQGPVGRAYGPSGGSHRYQGGNYGDEYPQDYRRPEEAPPGYHDRRYREPPRGPPFEGDRGYRPPHGGGHYPPDFRYSQGRDVRTTPKGQRSGGTSLVIGTSKPIHVPKTPSGPPERKSSTLASVFRGRPGSDSDRAAPPGVDEDSPQKILLSLRTPTSSFEEKTTDSQGKKSSGAPLSPDGPPRIQNSHQQRPADQLFEVRYCLCSRQRCWF